MEPRRPVLQPSSSSPWYERLAWHLDQAFVIPGTNIRFGWDAILGLVPGLGDAVTGVVQALLILAMAGRGDFPLSVILRMIANVALDNTLGAIPIVGDVFDIFFKANTRNLRLVQQVEHERRITGRVSRRRHIAFLAMLAAGLFAFVIASVSMAILMAKTMWSYLQGQL